MDKFRPIDEKSVMEALDAIRAISGLNASAFAKKLNLNSSSVYRVADGVGLPNLENMETWTRFGGQRLSEFLGQFEDESPSHAKKFAVLLSATNGFLSEYGNDEDAVAEALRGLEFAAFNARARAAPSKKSK